jgi:hypothetical protein
MLTGAGFSNYTLRAELFSQQHLANRIVDLMRASVREVFALQPHLCAPALRQAAGMRQRRRAADPTIEFGVKLGKEIWIVQIAVHADLQPIERWY